MNKKPEKPKDEEATLHYINHESRITRLESTMDNINATLIRLENNVVRLDIRIDSNFKWTIGTVCTIGLAIVGILYKH